MNKQEINEALPWYANDSLSAEERAEIEQALENNTELQQETEFLNKLRNTIQKNQIQSPGEFGLQKLKRSIKTEEKPTSDKWRVFTIAASIMLVVQVGIMTTLIQQEQTYVPLSGVEPGKNIIQVQFNEQAKEIDIRNTLLQFNAEIIEGPSKQGIYRIRLDQTDESNIDIHVNKLNNMQGIVDFAESE